MNSVICNKPVNSAAHYSQWSHFLWHVVTQFLWKIPECHSHLWIYSQNNQIFRQICIIKYSTEYYFKLTLKILFFLDHVNFLQKLDSDYLILISKF